MIAIRTGYPDMMPDKREICRADSTETPTAQKRRLYRSVGTIEKLTV